MSEHDPTLQASYVRQCLAQEKRPIGFFLGAGCPLSVRIKDGGMDLPLIPDIKGMTLEIGTILSSSPLKSPYERAVKHFEDDKRPAPTVEELLGHVRSLRSVAGLGEVRGLSAGELSSLDERICDSIVSLANRRLPTENTPYHKLAAWVGAADRTFPVEVFTTNYDLLVEEALEANRVPYFDGFVGSFQTFFDLQAIESDHLPSRWARLWKLHGSLNWSQDSKGSIRRMADASGCRVIYPSHLKYDESRRMPYLAMLDRLRAFLKHPTAVLIICGYSFSDIHLNEIVVQGLQGNPTAVAFGFLYGDLANYAGAIAAAQNRANLNLLARNEGMIGTKRAVWVKGREASVCVDSHGVKWIPDPADASKKDATFTLGDFASLALLTEELIGERMRSEELLDAK
jgi:hypothetical protein